MITFVTDRLTDGQTDADLDLKDPTWVQKGGQNEVLSIFSSLLHSFSLISHIMIDGHDV